MMLQLQLSGELEAWLNQEEMAGGLWMNEMRELMCRLEKRYETSGGLEQAIRRFEESKQQLEEQLRSFMV